MKTSTSRNQLALEYLNGIGENLSQMNNASVMLELSYIVCHFAEHYYQYSENMRIKAKNIIDSLTNKILLLDTSVTNNLSKLYVTNIKNILHKTL